MVLAACAALLVYKLHLVRTVNLNWDEFYFLSHVYELDRHQLTVLLQGAYTHLFRWLTRIGNDEVDQLIAARYVMTLLHWVSAWLVWRLARRYLAQPYAAVSTFAYVAAFPVMLHAGSFRADSLITPLLLAAIVLLARRNDLRSDVAAGLALGLATTISIKVVLFAPTVGILLLDPQRHLHDRGNIANALKRAALIAALAGSIFVALLALHSLTIVQEQSDSLVRYSSSTASRVLLDNPWFAQLPALNFYLRAQPVAWVLLVVGFIVALARTRFDIAALGLSLSPVVFYRNSFPYFYVVMLAPASVLVGYGLEQLFSGIAKRQAGSLPKILLLALIAGLMLPTLRFAPRMSWDYVTHQREILAGIHEIFQHPQAYIDRCGMVSSFPKANFFMSTWGLTSYRESGEPFVRESLKRLKPAFVLLNSPALHPSSRALLPDDRAALSSFYHWYWGPVWVAGAVATVGPGQRARLNVPFAARYRLETPRAVLIDGHLRDDGDLIDLQHAVDVELTAASYAPVSLRLIVASAGTPPAWQPAPVPIFTGL